MRRAILTAAVLTVTLGSLPARAATQIYVGEYKFNDPRLHVMEPGGLNVQELTIIPAQDWLVVGVQIDAGAPARGPGCAGRLPCRM
jgi:hypothetical protein